MIAKAIQSSTTSTLPISSESMAGFSLAGPPLPVVVELSPVDLLIGLPLLDSPPLDLTLLVEALQVIALMSSECSQLVTDLLLVDLSLVDLSLVDLSLVDLVLAAEERQATCLVSAQCLGLEYMEYHQTSLIVVSAIVARYFQVMTWSYLRSYCSY